MPSGDCEGGRLQDARRPVDVQGLDIGRGRGGDDVAEAALAHVTANGNSTARCYAGPTILSGGAS